MRDFIYSPPQDPFLSILYRDSSIIVVDKPAGLLSVPGRLAEHHDSALARVRRCCPDAAAVHRLDMDTSGLLVFGNTRKAVSALCRQFEERTVGKLYLARVDGDPGDEGEVNVPMRCDWERRPLQIVDFTQGKKALTSFRTLERDNGTSLVLLSPHTGRSHQLRVHMAYLGHPILGDRFYAPKTIQERAERLLLHSCVLEFAHPASGESMRFLSLPDFAPDLDPRILVI